MGMTQTHASEVQKTLSTTAVIQNKESPSQRAGHLGTSTRLQTKQEDKAQAPPEGVLDPQLPVCSGSLWGWGVMSPKGKRKSYTVPIHWDCGLLIREIVFCNSVALQIITCTRAKSLQSCLTLCNPRDCSLPGSSVHGILQARYWSGFHALLQEIFPIQGSNAWFLRLLHCRQILFLLGHQGSPVL